MMVTAALMAACSTEENGMGANKDAVSISTRVTLGSDPAQTRADGTSAYTSANATLTLCYGSVDSGQKSTFTCAGGSWSTAQPLYWQDLKPAGGTYAFFAVAPEMPGDVHKGEVRKDQSTSSINRGAAGTLTAFEASDLLMAYQTTTKSGTLDLNLKHLLSQLQVKLVSVSGSDGLTAAELASATLTIDGLKTQYSLAYNGTSGNSTSGNGGDATIPSTACPALATATADAATNGLTPYTDGTGNAKSFRFIAPAQTLTAGALTLRFTLTIGGTAHSYTYTSTRQEMNLTVGAITLLTITASRTTATLAGVSVTDWSTPATITGTVGITISGSADTPTGSAPAFSTMKMWKGKEEFTAASGGSAPGTRTPSEPGKTEAPAGAHLYNRNSSSWTDASPTPFYVDDVASTDRFYALAENTESDGSTAIHDAKTGLKDPVAAGPTSMNGGAVALTYSHLLAKLHITLTASGNFGANLTNATISSPEMFPGYTLSYSTGDAITATATGTKAKYHELSAGTDYIVVPQTVSGNFSVALGNGNTYTATLSSPLTLEAGKITTLALTLSLTQATIKVAVTDWGTGSTANETITIGSITSTGGVSGSDNSFAPATGDKLDIADAGNSATGTYTYGSSWTSTAPLYWDALNPSGSPYTFNALFTPAAGTDTDTGLVKDYQGGKASDVTFGNELSFTLSHLMAQVSVTVKPGEGYEDATASDITVSLNNLKKLAHIGTDGILTLDDATGALTLGNPTEDGGGSGGNGNGGGKSFTATALIAPQTVAAGTVLVTVGINGSNYTLKVPAQPAGGFAYQPGKKNSITLTINKSEASLSFKVEGWDTDGSTTEGDGELVEPTAPATP